MRTWYHVRDGEKADWGRCARLLVGRGIGICLGGGGARGEAHVGAIRAMRELNLPIDVVSGTSFGALVGGMYAATALEDDDAFYKLVERVLGKEFSITGMLMDFTWPRTSKFTGAYINKLVRSACSPLRVEDLPIPFSCTSTDIYNLESAVHRKGPLWRVVRASMSLVGLVPPLPHTENKNDPYLPEKDRLLVDGGYTNNFPVEELRDRGAGVVIKIEVSGSYLPMNYKYGDTVQGCRMMLQKRFRCSKLHAHEQPPIQNVIEERLIFLCDKLKDDESRRHTDVHMKMPIEGYGFLEFDKYKELDDLGYDTAMPIFTKWLEEDMPATRVAKEAINAQKRFAAVPAICCQYP